MGCHNDDLLAMFRLNFVMLTLIPKEDDARTMKKFRPISLDYLAVWIDECLLSRSL